MTTTAILLRDAVAADAPALARLHVAVWRIAYRDLAPPAAFAALDEARRGARWTAVFADPDPDPDRVVIVAETDGGLAGFVEAARPGTPEFGAVWEIKHLYVDTGLARRGIGRRLMAAVAARLVGRAPPGVALGVVAGNTPAFAFYAALRGRITGAYTDPGPLWRSTNRIVAWGSAAELVAACEGRGG